LGFVLVVKMRAEALYGKSHFLELGSRYAREEEGSYANEEQAKTCPSCFFAEDAL
jgi:hypothetical protein